MNIFKKLSPFLVVLGILLVIAGPIWSRFHTSRLRSMENQMKETIANPENISADSPVEKEFAKDMAIQMARVAGTVRHSMCLLYIGVLCALVGLAGVTFCLNHEIRTKEVPNQTSELTS